MHKIIFNILLQKNIIFLFSNCHFQITLIILKVLIKYQFFYIHFNQSKLLSIFHQDSLDNHHFLMEVLSAIIKNY